jgi:dATP pyrophosphohydrolase
LLIVSEHIEVCVYRRSGGEIEYLVLKRSSNVVLPGIWQIVTGTIDEGETAYEAAFRELKEETGLEPKTLSIGPDVTAFYRHDNDSMNLIPLFIAEAGAEDIALCSEHCGHKWLSYEEAKKLVHWYDQKENLRKVNECLTDPELSRSLVKIKLQQN